MQNIFLSKNNPKDYVAKRGAGEYPDAPKKCPYGDCGINIEMKKNGFYRRFLITITFSGKIRIRRYKCLKCGRTLSMLPSFCLSGYSYSVEFIVTLLQYVINIGSIKKAAREWRTCICDISRRLINKYLRRLRDNRKMIQYVLNQLSPDNIGIGRIPGDTDWTKSFLSGMQPTLWPEFNAKFHKITGKSFMSLHNSIA
jgi:hypothetical protein